MSQTLSGKTYSLHPFSASVVGINLHSLREHSLQRARLSSFRAGTVFAKDSKNTTISLIMNSCKPPVNCRQNKKELIHEY
jgi:hypothetical protein